MPHPNAFTSENGCLYVDIAHCRKNKDTITISSDEITNKKNLTEYIVVYKRASSPDNVFIARKSIWLWAHDHVKMNRRDMTYWVIYEKLL
jgi:hypothetical protein